MSRLVYCCKLVSVNSTAMRFCQLVTVALTQLINVCFLCHFMFVILTNKHTGVELARYCKFIAVAMTTLSSLKVKKEAWTEWSWSCAAAVRHWQQQQQHSGQMIMCRDVVTWLWDNHVTDKPQTPSYHQPFVLSLFSTSPATLTERLLITCRPTGRSDRGVMVAYYRSYHHMAPSLTLIPPCCHDSQIGRKPGQWTVTWHCTPYERDLSKTIRNEKRKCFRCPQPRTKMKFYRSVSFSTVTIAVCNGVVISQYFSDGIPTP